jgi:predicted branched-subunit amino acid permease
MEESSTKGGGESFLAGLRAGSPILMGLLPFGLIYGAAAKGAGLSLIQTVLMSLTIFAGSAQLVFVNLWHDGVNLVALAATVILVNLRLLIYGSSIGPFLEEDKGLVMRLVRSYILTDESYAISLSNFIKPNFSYRRTFFFLGAGFPTWLGWQCMGITGFLAGAFLPESVPLHMAIPLIFLSLLLSMLKSGGNRLAPKIVAVLASGLSAVLLKPVPYNLGLILAIFIGVAFGVLSSGKFSQKAS